MLPFIEVSHLPSSSSFYSAVLDPLGIHFLEADAKPGQLPYTVFGSAATRVAVLELRQVTTATADSRPRRSHVVFSAPSATAVDDVRTSALRANPDSRVAITGSANRHLETTSSAGTDAGIDQVRATITDLDGNTMDVTYYPPPGYPSHYRGSTVRRTQSTNNEASRILDWNYDVASSSAGSSPSIYGGGSHAGNNLTLARRPRGSHFIDDEPVTVVRRSTTTTTTTRGGVPPSSYGQPAPDQPTSGGFSTSTVVGTLLGVAAGAAAGAALTLTAMRSDRGRAPYQEFDAPAFNRRATFPEPYPDQKGRYVEVERTVEKIRYPEAYPVTVDHRGPPPYIARYRQAGASRSKEVDDIALEEDTRSRRSSRSRHTSNRTRSEVSGARKPLLLADVEHRSYTVSSRATKHPPIVQRSYTYDSPADAGSYVSARSHRSSSTIRAPAPVTAAVSAHTSHTHTPSRPGVGSRVASAARVEGSISQRPRSLSRTTSYVSARQVPLPLSGVGSSHADWDDDADSVAPSDSISCVGSRRSGRSYH